MAGDVWRREAVYPKLANGVAAVDQAHNRGNASYNWATGLNYLQEAGLEPIVIDGHLWYVRPNGSLATRKEDGAVIYRRYLSPQVERQEPESGDSVPVPQDYESARIAVRELSREICANWDTQNREWLAWLGRRHLEAMAQMIRLRPHAATAFGADSAVVPRAGVGFVAMPRADPSPPWFGWLILAVTVATTVLMAAVACWLGLL